MQTLHVVVKLCIISHLLWFSFCLHISRYFALALLRLSMAAVGWVLFKKIEHCHIYNVVIVAKQKLAERNKICFFPFNIQKREWFANKKGDMKQKESKADTNLPGDQIVNDFVMIFILWVHKKTETTGQLKKWLQLKSGRKRKPPIICYIFLQKRKSPKQNTLKMPATLCHSLNET